MAPTFMDRLKRVFNAFKTEEEENPGGSIQTYGAAYSTRPDRVRSFISNERSIITSIYTRIAIDVASVDIKHARLDDQKRYLEDIDSGLNNCLNLEANIDQGSRDFMQDVAMTLCDKGVLGIVPVDTTLNPNETSSYDILTMRVGEIVNWYPNYVKMMVYNDRRGKRQELTLPKRVAAVVQNPLYAIMNEPNSTLQRLIRKLNLLDAVDEQSASGKLDMIIQLPYVIKSEARRQQAEQRRADIEFQLKGSKYGIAYTDGTEKITQLNRPVENNLMKEIEYLTTKLYGELGITAGVMDGTADETVMLNYWNRTIEPIVESITQAMKRTFLTKTARSQNQSIVYFRNPFKFIPLQNIADIADKFSRNEIMSSNEWRQILGLKPSSDPKADQLINSNMPTDKTGVALPGTSDVTPASSDTSAPSDTSDNSVLASSFDSIDSAIDEAFSGLGIDEGATADEGS